METIQKAEFESDPATNADLANLKSELIMWVIGVQIAGSGLLLATKFLG